MDRSGRRTLFHVLLICAVILLVNGNTLFFGFSIDDYPLIVNNSFVRNTANIPRLLSPAYFPEAGQFSYRPVETLSYIIDYRLSGLNPFGYHVHNLLLALAGALLLYAYVRIASGSPHTALLSALVFAVHPVNSEAISAVSYRNDPQVLVFALTALCLHARAARVSAPVRRHLLSALSLTALAAALLTKESALAIAGFLLLHEYALERRSLPGSLKAAWPFITLTAVFLILRFTLLRAPQETYPEPLAERLYIVPRIFLLELRQLFFPYPLRAYYQFHIPEELFTGTTVLLYLVLVSVCAAYAFLFIRKPVSLQAHYAIFAFGWVLLSLVLVSNIYPLAWPYVEKYLYIPSAGLSVFLGYIAWRYCAPAGRPRIPALIALGAVLALTGLYSAGHNYGWSSQLTYWQTAYRNARNPLVCYNLANSLAAAGRHGEAESLYKCAITNHPRVYKRRAFRNVTPLAHCNLGALYLERGNTDKARNHFEKALSRIPDLTPASVGAAVSSYKQGDTNSALRYADNVLQVEPDNPACLYIRGQLTDQTDSGGQRPEKQEK
ncbi:MAG: tetratricopeptide repeat protein [Kiritimatiellia bacterium]